MRILVEPRNTVGERIGTDLTRFPPRRPTALEQYSDDYLEGALGPADHARFDAQCDGCNAYLDQMRTTLEGLGHLAPEDLEPEAEELFLATFRAWKQRPNAT